VCSSSALLTVLLTVLRSASRVPPLREVYQSVNANLELPLPTRVVQAAGTFIAANGLVILAALAVVYVLYRLRVQAAGGAEWRTGWLLRPRPSSATCSRKLALSRFRRTSSAASTKSGVEVAPSLAIIERVIGNAYIARRFPRRRLARARGDPLSRALGAVGESRRS